MLTSCPRCSPSEEILFTERLDLVRLSHVRVELADSREGHVSRSVPLVTFAFERNRSEATPLLGFRYDPEQEFEADAATPQSRQRRPEPIELQCP